MKVNSIFILLIFYINLLIKLIIEFVSYLNKNCLKFGDFKIYLTSWVETKENSHKYDFLLEFKISKKNNVF